MEVSLAHEAKRRLRLSTPLVIHWVFEKHIAGCSEHPGSQDQPVTGYGLTGHLPSSTLLLSHRVTVTAFLGEC